MRRSAIYLPEAALVGPLNEWLAQLFNEDNLDRTVASLTASPSIDRGSNAAQQRLHNAEARCAGFRRRSLPVSILPLLSRR